jgi:hypothetical protein
MPRMPAVFAIAWRLASARGGGARGGSTRAHLGDHEHCTVVAPSFLCGSTRRRWRHRRARELGAQRCRARGRDAARGRVRERALLAMPESACDQRAGHRRLRRRAGDGNGRRASVRAARSRRSAASSKARVAFGFYDKGSFCLKASIGTNTRTGLWHQENNEAHQQRRSRKHAECDDAGSE